MPIKYTIEGDLIKKEETLSVEIGRLSEMLPMLTTYMPLSISPLPHGIQYIRVEPKGSDGMRVWCIVERQPMVTRINYKPAPASSPREPESFRIHLPYQFYWFVLDATQMQRQTTTETVWSPQNWGLFWGKQPFSGLETEATYAHMPNCWQNGTICFGSTNVQSNTSLGRFVDSAINNFLTSEFNRDLDYEWPYQSMRDWNKAAEEDPMSWMGWDLWNARGRTQTLDQWLTNLMTDEMRWRTAVPSVADSNMIPPIPVRQTFHNVTEWIEGLDPNDRARLKEAINVD